MTGNGTKKHRLAVSWETGRIIAALLGITILAKDPTGPALSAAERRSPEKAALPVDLALVPPDALAFTRFRIAALRADEAAKDFWRQLAKGIAEVPAQIEEGLGVPLDDIEEMTVMVLAPNDGQPVDLEKFLNR
jgi:hypothetical protein